MLRLLATVVVLAVVACAHVASGQLQRVGDRYVLPPRDDASQDSDFQAFRGGFQKALASRDLASLTSAAAPSVQAQVKALVALGRGAQEWAELERLIGLGGVFTTTRGAQPGRREFCAPYVYALYPKAAPEELMTGETDPWVILGDRVPVRSEQRPNAPVLAELSFQLIRADGPFGTTPRWAQVELGNDRLGWVLWDQIRDPEDYHACFARVDGRWLLTAFDRGRPPRTDP